MCLDSSAKILLTHSTVFAGRDSLSDELTGLPADVSAIRFDLDAVWNDILSTVSQKVVAFPPLYDDAETFCIIYTSGSTGKPKGCELRWGSFLNYVQWFAKAYEIHPGEK
jgi:acyl-coenzyme A synthetase/AMP-(fatty) acid ligase